MMVLRRRVVRIRILRIAAFPVSIGMRASIRIPHFRIEFSSNCSKYYSYTIISPSVGRTVLMRFSHSFTERLDRMRDVL